jgi:hypothetical protein
MKKNILQESVCQGTAELYRGICDHYDGKVSPAAVFTWCKNDTRTGQRLKYYGPVFKDQLNAAINTFCKLQGSLYGKSFINTSLTKESQEILGIYEGEPYLLLKVSE